MTDYQPYTNMPSVPAGVILDRIIRQQNRKKVDVANSAHLIQQRLNDLIKGNRRFTPSNSMLLEKTLGIDIVGFFYLIQAKHDIFIEQKNLNSVHKPNMSILSKSTFWDVDLNKIDWTKCEKWAIRRVLEYGECDEIKEIANFYGIDKIHEILSNPSNFRIYDNVIRRVKECGL